MRVQPTTQLAKSVVFAVFTSFSMHYIPPQPHYNGNPCCQTAATLDPLKPDIRTDSGFQSTLQLLDSSINTHKPFCRIAPPKTPSRFPSFSAITISTRPPRKHICQKDRSVSTAVIFWLSSPMRRLPMWEQTEGITIFCWILVYSGICCGLISAILEIGRTNIICVSDICRGLFVICQGKDRDDIW